MLTAIVSGIVLFLQVICYLALIYFVLRLFIRSDNRIMQLLSRFIEPLLQPLRNLLGWFFPRMPIDLAPMVLVIVVQLLSSVLSAMARIPI